MSEKLAHGGEKSFENIDTSRESKEYLEKLRQRAESAENDPIQGHIESLNRAAEQQAVSGNEVNVGDHASEQSTQTFGITKQLKADAYKQMVKKAQSNLNVPQRAFSKLIHLKVVDTSSNAAAKTIARPSAFLGGSVGALVGSAVLLYFSRQNGFSYNYAAIFVLFVGGFFVGALVELIARLLFRKRSS